MLWRESDAAEKQRHCVFSWHSRRAHLQAPARYHQRRRASRSEQRPTNIAELFDDDKTADGTGSSQPAQQPSQPSLPLITEPLLISNRLLYAETSAVFVFFIVYLVRGSLRRPAVLYHNEWIAYLCIQGRGLAAMLGTSAVLMAAQIQYCLAKIRSVPLQLASPQEAQVALEIVFRWINSFRWLAVVLHNFAFLSLFTFMIAYSAARFSVYIVQGLNFVGYFVIFVALSLFMLVMLRILAATSDHVIARLLKMFSPKCTTQIEPCMMCPPTPLEATPHLGAHGCDGYRRDIASSSLL